MRFDMFERLGPGFLRSKTRVRPTVQSVAVIVRRPTVPTLTATSAASTNISSLGQPCADPENRAFRVLDRHTRWAMIHDLAHARAPQ